jgi:pimeloyl-ACP methyl ester carboxylesterase
LKPWITEQGKSAFYRQIAQADSKFTDEFQDKFTEINIPVLILWGEEDQWIPSEQSYLLNSKIKGSKVVTVPNSGHLIIEEKPLELVTEILRFLSD